MFTHFDVSVNDGWSLRVHVSDRLTGFVENPQNLSRT